MIISKLREEGKCKERTLYLMDAGTFCIFFLSEGILTKSNTERCGAGGSIHQVCREDTDHSKKNGISGGCSISFCQWTEKGRGGKTDRFSDTL